MTVNAILEIFILTDFIKIAIFILLLVSLTFYTLQNYNKNMWQGHFPS